MLNVFRSANKAVLQTYFIVAFFSMSLSVSARDSQQDYDSDKGFIYSSEFVYGRVKDCESQDKASLRDYKLKCLNNVYQDADASLNQKYFKLTSILHYNYGVSRLERYKLMVAAIRESQRQWISFRDKECNYIKIIDGTDSAAANILYEVCLIDQTFKRSNQLAEYLNCDGIYYDFCPVSAG